MTNQNDYSTEQLNELAGQTHVEDVVVFDIAQALLAFAKEVYAKARRKQAFEPMACTSELLERAIRTAFRKCDEFQSRKHFDNTIAQRIRRDVRNAMRMRREEFERLQRVAHQRPSVQDDPELTQLIDLLSLVDGLDELQSSLPEAHAVVNLRVFVASDRHEAAEQLGLSIHQVDRRYQSAIVFLQQSMGAADDE